MKRVILFSIVLALAFACGKDKDSLRGETKEVQIIISDPSAGPLQMTARPDPATIGRDGAVKWQIVYKTGPQLDSVIIDGFKDPKGATDPFDGGSRFVFTYLGSGSSGPSQTSGPPNKGGDFKYNVTVTVAGSAPVVFDPRLIVNY
jgi:hypothetical protein